MGTPLSSMHSYYRFRALVQTVVLGSVYGVACGLLVGTNVHPLGAVWFLIFLAASALWVWAHLAVRGQASGEGMIFHVESRLCIGHRYHKHYI